MAQFFSQLFELLFFIHFNRRQGILGIRYEIVGSESMSTVNFFLSGVFSHCSFGTNFGKRFQEL
ncbi:hypothetical protein LEP1GSC062_0189 [Leptospira alexanderi serovar Manhao 3 str. L 60]|uniref:Uncharacterized protein n=1 Tax=Leptospira alexanderi serovar Manhao 3 str. L 60 TaxID=1049759 RepID=V6HUM3_9LEPT|nr:hypothetical protein LEP1GSC062_0189 [Leptospira alexanderi serovar Manhao 3 str. L 60]